MKGPIGEQQRRACEERQSSVESAQRSKIEDEDEDDWEYISKPPVDIELQDVVFVGRSGDCVRAQPAKGKPDVRGKSKRTSNHVSFEIRAAAAEIGIVKAIHHRIGFDVSIVQEQVPIPALFEDRVPDFQADNPCSVPTDETPLSAARTTQTPVVDGYRVDRCPVERKVGYVFAQQRCAKRLKMIEIQFPGKS